MKAVILLAGKGRRIEKLGLPHKALIKLEGKTLLSYIIENVKKAGIDEIVPIVGHNGKEVLDEINRVNTNLKVYPIWNEKYDISNNLFSLCQAKEILDGEEFISINGDMIFDYRILEKIATIKESSIAIDDVCYNLVIDSPGVVIEEKRIKDLGRHIRAEDRGGYAVGIYKYGKALVPDFFELADEMLKENLNHGFHDPLRKLFGKYDISVCSVENYKWTDIDEEGDIEQALKILRAISC